MPAADARRRKPAMNRAWFLLWAVVIWQIAAWTFGPTVPLPQIPEVNRGKAYGSNEDLLVEARGGQRQGALKALDQPWGSRCAGEERKRFISGLNEYYYHRQNQTERYPENFGKLGADYIAKQWSTTDDQRIDRLTQDAYARGYLKAADFDGVAGKMVATVVKDERITGKGCAG
jgi:hypothetical protein